MSDRHPSEERLMAFLEGALSVEEQAHLEQHLELCSRCSLERDQLSAVIQSIPSLRVDEKEVRAARASLQKALDEPTVMIPRWVPLSLAVCWAVPLCLLRGKKQRENKALAYMFYVDSHLRTLLDNSSFDML